MCTPTNPAAKTISIGLPGQISTCRFLFAAQPRQLYLDETTSCHLPGLLQKPLQQQGNLLYCRAVMLKRQRLTRQFLPGQHAPKHNSEEHNLFRLDNNDGFCSATYKVHLDKQIHVVLQRLICKTAYLDKKPSTHQSGLVKTISACDKLQRQNYIPSQLNCKIVA